MANNKITVEIPSRSKVGEKYVAVPKKEYERYTKYQTEITDALKKIRRGNKELRSGKTNVIKSVSELM